MIVFMWFARLPLAAKVTLALVAIFATAVALVFGLALGPFMPLEN